MAVVEVLVVILGLVVMLINQVVQVVVELHHPKLVLQALLILAVVVVDLMTYRVVLL